MKPSVRNTDLAHVMDGSYSKASASYEDLEELKIACKVDYVLDIVYKDLLSELCPLFPNRDLSPSKLCKLNVARNSRNLENGEGLSAFLIPELQSITIMSSISDKEPSPVLDNSNEAQDFTITDNIMKNFLKLKNYEMRRTREQKLEFD